MLFGGKYLYMYFVIYIILFCASEMEEARSTAQQTHTHKIDNDDGDVGLSTLWTSTRAHVLSNARVMRVFTAQAKVIDWRLWWQLLPLMRGVTSTHSRTKRMVMFVTEFSAHGWTAKGERMRVIWLHLAIRMTGCSTYILAELQAPRGYRVCRCRLHPWRAAYLGYHNCDSPEPETEQSKGCYAHKNTKRVRERSKERVLADSGSGGGDSGDTFHGDKNQWIIRIQSTRALTRQSEDQHN